MQNQYSEIMEKLNGLNLVEWKMLVLARLKGEYTFLPQPNLQVDEEWEDIIIRLIPLLDDPRYALHSLIELLNDAVNDIKKNGMMNEGYFISLLFVIRYLMIDISNKYSYKEEVDNSVNEFVFDAIESVKGLIHCFGNNTKVFSERVKYVADGIESFSLPKHRPNLAKLFYGSLKGVVE